MTQQHQIYKCEVCGNIVEILHRGAGTLVCCEQKMSLMEAQIADSTVEKHVPFIERKDDEYIVRVGENTLHPMQEKHFIEWIELIVDGVRYRKYLVPGRDPRPELRFQVAEGNYISAREYCNIHGLWRKE